MTGPRKDRLETYGLPRSVRTPKRMSRDMSRHSFYAMFCDVY
jgi:hypothetical protein